MEKQQLLPHLSTRPPYRRSSSALLYIFFFALLLSTELFRRWTRPIHPPRPSGLLWKDCDDGLQCARFELPLDWDNLADVRTVSLNVLRKPAADQREKLGSLYINSSDQVSCFSSALQQHLYLLNSPGSLDLPANFTALGDSSLVMEDLERQVRLTDASMTALFQRCHERTGDQLAYVGTKSVVRDLDALARAIDGEEARINYWGMSYGTIVGRYMTSLLPPSRLGRVLLDGVVNASMWATPTDHSHPFSGLQDIQLVLDSFAASCAAAGPACALSHLGSGPAILASLSSLIDSVHHQPLPLPELQDVAPGLTARALHVKKALFGGAYRVKEWPALAEGLDKALKGNLVDLVNATLPKLEVTWADAAQRPGISSSQATVAIRCADAPPSPSPSTDLIATDVLAALSHNGLLGDGFFDLSFCHRWPVASKSFYNFTAEPPMREGRLDTPILITNQRHDPVTPLAAAKLALVSYGTDNARLLEQRGDGHCVIGQVSLCTARIIRAYFLDDKVPDAAHTICEVDELPFGGPAEYGASAEVVSAEERELLQLWQGSGLVRGLGW